MADDAPLSLIHSEEPARPLQFVNPTGASFRHIHKRNGAEDKDQKLASNIRFHWTSRNNRKGRHAISVKPEDAASSTYDVPSYSTEAAHIGKVILRMALYYPVWDISWLVAYVFTLGSVVWVINAFLVFYPDLHQVGDEEALVYYGGGITAFIGATIFEIGSVLLILEAFNAHRGGCFGWAFEDIFTSGEKMAVRARPSSKHCVHHHIARNNLVKASQAEQGWTWWPSSEQFTRHYFHDLGFIASAAQMTGASIFWISGFTALPGIYDNLSPGALIGVYWVPQLVGGSFFIISGALFMLETQQTWWKPAFGVLGWHIGAWNLIGGLGFTLCPAFGLATADWAQYQSSCSTFWGSWAFLIGSVIQWYESLDKHPVEKAK